jgi:LacI family transcriptional regulator
VLAFNDLVAIGLQNALVERGVRVPEQVSIAGFDDIPFASYTTPALTTAAVPVEELGEQAWSRLNDLLAGRTPADDVSYVPTLKVRGSTGPAPTAAAGV